ncbi:unnamed protein product [Effrenium voratum]|nr:unnamed protein product [Effrenium voratum]
MAISKAQSGILEEAVASFEAALAVLEDNELLETDLGARVLQNLSVAQAQMGDEEAAARSEAEAKQILEEIQYGVGSILDRTAGPGRLRVRRLIVWCCLGRSQRMLLAEIGKKLESAPVI